MSYLVDLSAKYINTSSSSLYMSCTFLNPFSAHNLNPLSFSPGSKLALPQIGLKREWDKFIFKYLQVSNQTSIIFNIIGLSVFFFRYLRPAEYKYRCNGKLGLTEQDSKSIQAGGFPEEK